MITRCDKSCSSSSFFVILLDPRYREIGWIEESSGNWTHLLLSHTLTERENIAPLTLTHNILLIPVDYFLSLSHHWDIATVCLTLTGVKMVTCRIVSGRCWHSWQDGIRWEVGGVSSEKGEIQRIGNRYILPKIYLKYLYNKLYSVLCVQCVQCTVCTVCTVCTYLFIYFDSLVWHDDYIN